MRTFTFRSFFLTEGDNMPSPYQYFSKSIALTASSFASALDVPGLGLSFLSAVSFKPAIAF